MIGAVAHHSMHKTIMSPLATLNPGDDALLETLMSALPATPTWRPSEAAPHHPPPPPHLKLLWNQV